MTTVVSPRDLYRRHAAPNTVRQGSLRTDLAPRTLLRAAQIMLAKQTLSRKRLPIKLDLSEYGSPDFRYDTSSVDEVEQRLQRVPLRSDGLRWVHLPDGVLFHAVRVVDVPYDEFVDRVDISRVGDCFRDVLGINTQVLRRDGSGRPVLQIERIAALAQPNYTAFLGKDELDVYKLEWQQYGADEQRNWMRTVCSPNGSTMADDSYMAFSRVPDRPMTRITFVARQAFPFPRVMVLSRMDRWSWLRTRLTEAAYRRFWHDTYGNMMARYEGRPVGIGRPSRQQPADRTRALVLTAAALVGALLLRGRGRRAGRLR
jgi:hypothetical protein